MFGTLLGTIVDAVNGGNFGEVAGSGLTLGAGYGVSIPFFAAGKHAYKVYNEYCAKPAKPTASLSFGPATNGIGMGVYLNF